MGEHCLICGLLNYLDCEIPEFCNRVLIIRWFGCDEWGMCSYNLSGKLIYVAIDVPVPAGELDYITFKGPFQLKQFNDSNLVECHCYAVVIAVKKHSMLT